MGVLGGWLGDRQAVGGRVVIHVCCLRERIRNSNISTHQDLQFFSMFQYPTTEEEWKEVTRDF